uniref:Uncharacterized protein n=1 Tax=Zooxanthella nutricula TaxID=1333877 RepID=A0A7S2J4F0_9DINO
MESSSSSRLPLREDSEDEFLGLVPESAERACTRRPANRTYVVAAGICLLGLVAWFARSGSPVQERHLSRTIVSLASEHKCHTARKGEPCYVDVQWAMTIGIQGHRDWYDAPCPSLTAESSFEAFQACVYKINQTSCPLPCNPDRGAADESSTTLKPSSDEAHTEDKEPPQDHPCHIARRGERCYDAVIDAMTSGFASSENGLTTESTFEDFQAVLHSADASSICPRPCSCHTAKTGEACYQHVMWAKITGIGGHPEWYRGLSQESTIEEVQAYLHKDAKGSCELPCNPMGDISVRAPPPHAKPAVEEAARETDSGAIDAAPGAQHFDAEHESHCSTAVKGQTCYDDVMFGVKQGITEHPEWYPGLSASSSFEDFQGVLHRNPELQCPKPCPCKTAVVGDKCLKNVQWVLREGIDQHPHWYQGLTVRSRFEAVQQRLHEDTNTTCAPPCTAAEWHSTTLFCFAVFRSEGYELELVRAQYGKRVGIFGCDEFAVLSDRPQRLGDAAGSLVSLMIPANERVGVSKDGTAANTEVFMQAWGVLWREARWRAHDWVIKADPDCVVIPSRLRQHLKSHTGKAVYVKNCMKYVGAGWPMMFGSLEAFSNQAMELYFKGAQKCKDTMQWQAWGEDLFMGNCLNMLGSQSIFDGGLIGDNVCKGANCKDGNVASFHPFKSVDSWFKCYHEAMG